MRAECVRKLHGYIKLYDSGARLIHKIHNILRYQIYALNQTRNDTGMDRAMH